VCWRNHFMSAGRRQGKRLSMPMTRSSAMAAIREIRGGTGKPDSSDRNRGLDMWMALVIHQLKILEDKIENIRDRRIKLHLR